MTPSDVFIFKDTDFPHTKFVNLRPPSSGTKTIKQQVRYPSFRLADVHYFEFHISRQSSVSRNTVERRLRQPFQGGSQTFEWKHSTRFTEHICSVFQRRIRPFSQPIRHICSKERKASTSTLFTPVSSDELILKHNDHHEDGSFYRRVRNHDK